MCRSHSYFCHEKSGLRAMPGWWSESSRYVRSNSGKGRYNKESKSETVQGQCSESSRNGLYSQLEVGRVAGRTSDARNSNRDCKRSSKSRSKSSSKRSSCSR